MRGRLWILVIAAGIAAAQFCRIAAGAWASTTPALAVNQMLDRRRIASLDLKANLARAAGQRLEASAAANELIRLHQSRLAGSDLPRWERGVSYEAMAVVKFQEGETDASERLAVQALREQPNLADASGVLVQTAVNRANDAVIAGDPSRAVDEIQNVLRWPLSEIWQVNALYQLGRFLEQAGRKQEAREAFERVVNEHPSLPNWVERASEALARLSEH